MPGEVLAIRKEIHTFFSGKDAAGRKLGSRIGVYAFYDFDGEPIYIGQTRESFSARIGRHLTNRRTDAVAMNVLDPFEVAEIAVWPLPPEVASLPKEELGDYLNKAEYTLYRHVLEHSTLGAVLNEKIPATTELIELPTSYRQTIIPESLRPVRNHPDIRLARRASTIAALARVISERNVSDGLRITLLTQAQRLEHLAQKRINELGITPEVHTGDEEG